MYLPTVVEPAPLIVLAHGLNGRPRKFTGLARHWAEAGFAVAVPRFPVSSDEFPDCDPDVLHRRLADVGDQAGDVAFVVDALLTGTAGRPAVSPSASIRDVSGSTACRSDRSRCGRRCWDRHCPPLAAVMQSDGAFPGDDHQLTGVDVPVFVAHSDVDPIFPAADVARQFEALAAPKFLLLLHGAAHAAVARTPRPPPTTPTASPPPSSGIATLAACRTPFPASIVVDGVTSFVDVS